MKEPREKSYPTYQAVVTAYFPTMDSGMRARKSLSELSPPISALNVQLHESTSSASQAPIARGTSLPPEVYMIIHLPDSDQKEAVIRVCNLSDATRATYYPAQSVIKAVK